MSLSEKEKKKERYIKISTRDPDIGIMRQTLKQLLLIHSNNYVTRWNFGTKVSTIEILDVIISIIKIKNSIYDFKSRLNIAKEV